MAAIEGYASATSVIQGSSIDLHVNVELPHRALTLQFFRLGQTEQLVKRDRITVSPVSTPENAYEVGCGWPVAYTLTVPQTWQSAVYRANLISDIDDTISTEILFAVKAIAPGSATSILFTLAVNTYQAYNGWGGKSLYDFNSTNRQKTDRISFDRPDRYEDFYLWEYPLIQWMEANGFTAEYCTNVDLHADSDLLGRYQLLLSVGHDEYWSWEMRDQVESFIAQGGNVAFLGGNLCWWQVRFEDNNRTLVCYKKANSDPISQIDPSRTTVNWKDSPVNRPENQMTGVSFAQGAGWFNSDAGPRPAVGYRVRLSQHWVFAGTNLTDDEVFGTEDAIIGYETDAAVVQAQNGILQATGHQGTPLNFITLATANLSNWGKGGQAGMATMGLFRNNGTVFTAATVDWTRGLLGRSPTVPQITRNLLRKLSQRRPLFPNLQNSDFEVWLDDTHPQDWSVEGSGKAQRDDQTQQSGAFSLKVDATAGQTWLTQGPFTCESDQLYRVSGWVLADRPGATLRLQSMETWKDWAIAEHPGNGQWVYVAAIAQPGTEAAQFPTRVKVEVKGGVIANFDEIRVERL